MMIAVMALAVTAKTQIMVGEWRTHMSYNNIEKVVQTPNLVYGLGDGALFSCGKADYDIVTWSKVNGLSGSKIQLADYDPKSGLLIVCYADGNVDMIGDGGDVINMPDIKQSSINADKTPTDLAVDGGGKAYLATEFGIVVLNTEKNEVKETYLIGDNNSYAAVNSVTLSADSIYALVGNTVKVAKKDAKMLVNSANWRTMKTKVENGKDLMMANGNLYLLTTDSCLLKIDVNGIGDTVKIKDDDDSDAKIVAIETGKDNNLIVVGEKSGFRIKGTETSQIYNGLNIVDCQDDMSVNGRCWLAAGRNGLFELNDNTVTQKIKPNGPASNKTFSLAYSDGRVFALTGNPRCYSAGDPTKEGAVMIYEDDEWKSITQNDVIPLVGHDFITLCYIYIDKEDVSHYYVSSARHGLYEFRNDVVVQNYGLGNSLLSNDYNFDIYDEDVRKNWVNCSGICVDKNNRLWMLNDRTATAVKMKDEEGEWHTYNYPNFNNPNFCDKVFVSSDNLKWFVKPNRVGDLGGVMVLNDNNKIENISGQQYKYISYVADQDGNQNFLEVIYDIKEDMDGSVWMCTSNGVFVFKNTSNIFSSNYTVTRPKIARTDGSGFADYLLDGQTVRAIAVDGANRKWIGTDASGVYLMSPDGLTEIHHFTMDNSPLLSDQITGITVNNKSGEVFFATANGLISYRGDATEESSDLDNIKAFPNPVRPGFAGVVTITGLMDGSTVRITDSAGSVVARLRSNGGEATWNLRNSGGRRVASGVYVVMVSSEENGSVKDTGVGKILVLD